jgi:hypothetical protein
MTDPQRKVGVPEGRTEYTEQMARYIYADGTMVDSPPICSDRTAVFAALADVIAAPRTPKGTRKRYFRRTVTTIASPWEEVPYGPDPAGDVSGD